MGEIRGRYGEIRGDTGKTKKKQQKTGKTGDAEGNGPGFPIKIGLKPGAIRALGRLLYQNAQFIDPDSAIIGKLHQELYGGKPSHVCSVERLATTLHLILARGNPNNVCAEIIARDVSKYDVSKLLRAQRNSKAVGRLLHKCRFS